jgi:hypothetical protein
MATVTPKVTRSLNLNEMLNAKQRVWVFNTEPGTACVQVSRNSGGSIVIPRTMHPVCITDMVDPTELMASRSLRDFLRAGSLVLCSQSDAEKHFKRYPDAEEETEAAFNRLKGLDRAREATEKQIKMRQEERRANTSLIAATAAALVGTNTPTLPISDPRAAIEVRQASADEDNGDGGSGGYITIGDDSNDMMDTVETQTAKFKNRLEKSVSNRNVPQARVISLIDLTKKKEGGRSAKSVKNELSNISNDLEEVDYNYIIQNTEGKLREWAQTMLAAMREENEVSEEDETSSDAQGNSTDE